MASLLLTGASGYLGAAIGGALEERGIPHDSLPCRLEQLAEGSLHGYQKIIHAAGAPRYRGEVAIDQANRIGTQRLLAALDGSPEMLFISSRMVYGNQSGQIRTEEDSPQPTEPYGRAKLAAEQAIRESRFPHLILRIPGLIGDTPAGLGHGFFAYALRHFMAGEIVFRYIPDRLHDNLDVHALAKICADWANGSLKSAQGILNVPGSRRSLHGTLAEFIAAAKQWGGKPIIQDRLPTEKSWPFMSGQRFHQAGGMILERSDQEIAAACCRKSVCESPKIDVHGNR